MATRYIWSQSELKESYELVTYENETSVVVSSTSWPHRYLIGMKTRPVLNQETGLFSYSGDSVVLDNDFGGGIGIKAFGSDGYRYATIRIRDPSGGSMGSTNINVTDIHDYYESDGVTSERYWNFYGNMISGPCEVRLQNSLGSGQYSFTYYMSYHGDEAPGDLLGYVSSSSPSAYPNSGGSGDYYYEAVDNDEIDPSSVSIPSQLIIGDSATITVNPSSGAISSEYGNISYLFSYKYDSEGWSQNTQGTGTTYSFNVASGKTKVIARVYVKDDIGFTSTDAVQSNTANIYASLPPSAPGSISVNRVVNGWDSTIKITAAMDTDGSIVNYKYYAAYKSQNGNSDWPNVDVSEATLIKTINALEIEYTINTSVNNEEIIFLVTAVNDSGIEGPAIISKSYTIEKNKIVLMGPARTDFGIKIADFKVGFSAIVGGDLDDKTLTLSVHLDESQLYSELINSDQLVEVEIDISALSKGQHEITVTGSKEGYDTVMAEYTFRIQDLVVPENSTLVQFQDSTGKPIIPEGDARGVFLSDGTILDDVVTSILLRLDILEG